MHIVPEEIAERLYARDWDAVLTDRQGESGRLDLWRIAPMPDAGTLG